MKYHVVALDRRHSWHNRYKYMLEFSKMHWVGTGVLDFDRARRWFAANWGWSQDVETQEAIANHLPNVTLLDDLNLHWAYSVQYKDYRIYVAGDKELAFFQLVHPSQAAE